MKYEQALLDAVIRQRDQALARLAQVEAELIVLREQMTMKPPAEKPEPEFKQAMNGHAAPEATTPAQKIEANSIAASLAALQEE